MTVRPAKVVVAPDKFKGSSSALEVATHLGVGLRQAAPGLDVRLAPVADGGEGTVEAAIASGFEPIVLEVSGPLGAGVEARIAVRGATAVVELAQASGLQLYDGAPPRPLSAGSAGTGELIRAALDAGCTTVILGLGGSASSDGGAGMVQALGARLIGERGSVASGGAALAQLRSIDLSELDQRIDRTTFVIASDVDNPLLGPPGAAAVFAPQKGATPDEALLLESALRRWAAVVPNRGG